MKKRKIAILSPRFDGGDAVGNDALKMRETLAELGHDCRLFAGGWSVEAGVSHFSKIHSFLDKESVLIYHYSIAWEDGRQIFRNSRCLRAIKYHNITPPSFFDPYHAGIANSCRAGLEMMGDFINSGCDLFLCDSAFNQADLVRMGADPAKCRVAPPFHAIDELENIEASFPAILDYAGSFPNPPVNWLMVGRIVPNKGYENLLKAFACYRRNYNANSKLILVGKFDGQLESYNRKLREIIEMENLSGSVTLTGHVTDSVLKSCYLSASIFTTMSEHEGFCVPLLEAMSIRLPVLALANTAILETAGDGALLMQGNDPARFAAAANEILSSEKASLYYGCKGFNRYRAEYSSEKIRSTLLAAMKDWIDG